jgi:hypothetical protein
MASRRCSRPGQGSTTCVVWSAVSKWRCSGRRAGAHGASSAGRYGVNRCQTRRYGSCRPVLAGDGGLRRATPSFLTRESGRECGSDRRSWPIGWSDGQTAAARRLRGQRMAYATAPCTSSLGYIAPTGADARDRQTPDTSLSTPRLRPLGVGQSITNLIDRETTNAAPAVGPNDYLVSRDTHPEVRVIPALNR